MLEEFRNFIHKKKLVSNSKPLLLAVSGGIDSLCMAHMFHACGYDCAIAHCNFSLRGNESEEDEIFVKNLAHKLGMKFYSTRFDTKLYAAQKSISIQMAARELRYQWFEELRKKENFQSIAIAHHRDDEAETFFINLLRGTGISGLTGYAEKHNNIIRPLLFASREQIETYCKKNKIAYRNDSSNAEDKYLRNNIRHHLIPAFETINKSFGDTLQKEMKRLHEVEKTAYEFVEQLKETLVRKEKNEIVISVPLLKKQKSFSFILYTLLKPYGFSGDIIDMLSISLSNTEKTTFISETHVLVKDRSEIRIQKKKKKASAKEYLIDESTTEITKPISLQFSKSKNKIISKNVNTALLDYSKLTFPLVLRKWKQGDFFIPLGMKGKKKLSDFFTDNKISYAQKAALWLVCSGEDIVWIAGYRIHEHYKITAKTINVFKIELK